VALSSAGKSAIYKQQDTQTSGDNRKDSEICRAQHSQNERQCDEAGARRNCDARVRSGGVHYDSSGAIHDKDAEMLR
jgi:hypothetical protein